jgi:hypothetical protein
MIEYLYIDQKMDLQATMRQMQKNHGFQATDKQYKRQFSRWGLRKNVPAKVMDAILSGNPGDPKTTNAKSRYAVPRAKIDRYARRQQLQALHQGSSRLHEDATPSKGTSMGTMTTPMGVVARASHQTHQSHVEPVRKDVWRPLPDPYVQFPLSSDHTRATIIKLVNWWLPWLTWLTSEV